MALINRDKDPSEQKEVIRMTWPSQVSTGASLLVGEIPCAGTIQSVRAIGMGVSGALQVLLRVARMAAGYTTIPVGISNLIVSNLGTSGPLGYSGLAATGSTLLQVLADDSLVVELVGANTAATQLTIDVVVKRTQDIVALNGVAT